MRRPFIYIIPVLFLVSACEYQFPETTTEYSAGTVNPEVFISIGGSFSSGIMDGALYSDGQKNSFPAILARQLSLVGGTPFLQPDIGSENGYNWITSTTSQTDGRFIYSFYSPLLTSPEKVVTAGEAVGLFNGIKNTLRDFSVPFLKAFRIDDPSLVSNPFYERMAPDPGNSTLLSDALAQHPTFFLLSIGFDDIMQYAASGADGLTDPPSDPEQVNEKDMTPVDLFEQALNHVISSLMEDPETKGIITNIPDIENIPYFYLYPYNFLKLSNARLIQVNYRYGDFNDAVEINNMTPDAIKRPFISTYDNGPGIISAQDVIVIDSTLGDAWYPGGEPLEKYRQLVKNEMVLYSIPDKMVGSGLGWLDPLANKYYLSLTEIAFIKARINAFNERIEQAAQAYPGRLAVVDMKTLFYRYSQPSIINAYGTPNSPDTFTWDGVSVDFNLGQYGVFSLDGIFLNPRGQALLANECIKTINSAFQAVIPLVNINDYPGNIFHIDIK